ncbi:TPA: flippase [Salmonella enterica]|nr:flippase [Salmonella enterica]HAV9262370.1 flippase [Salmonella enterica]
MLGRYIKKININVEIKGIISNTGWLLFDKFIRLIFGLLVGVWVARYLGPDTYGQLAYVITLISFFQVVSLLGMDTILVRDIAHKKDQANEILGTAIIMRFGAGLLCLIVAVSFVGFFNGTYFAILTLLAGGSLIFQCIDTIDIWFQSQSQSKRTVIAKLCSYVVTNIIRIVLILCHAPVWGFALLLSIDALFSALALSCAYTSFKTTDKWRITLSRGKNLLRESWPFLISGISIIMYMRLDQIMIKNLLGEKSLGIYAAVLQFSLLWNFIPITLSVSLAPYIARKKKENEQAYYNAINNVFIIFSSIGWGITLTISILSPFIINFMLGSSYADGAVVLSIHVVTNLFICLGVAQSLWIVNERKGLFILYKSLTGLLVCGFSNLILIPLYGIKGAAIAAVLSQLSASMLFNFVFAKKIFLMQIKSLFLIKTITKI